MATPDGHPAGESWSASSQENQQVAATVALKSSGGRRQANACARRTWSGTGGSVMTVAAMKETASPSAAGRPQLGARSTAHSLIGVPVTGIRTVGQRLARDQGPYPGDAGGVAAPPAATGTRW